MSVQSIRISLSILIFCPPDTTGRAVTLIAIFFTHPIICISLLVLPQDFFFCHFRKSIHLDTRLSFCSNLRKVYIQRIDVRWVHYLWVQELMKFVKCWAWSMIDSPQFLVKKSCMKEERVDIVHYKMCIQPALDVPPSPSISGISPPSFVLRLVIECTLYSFFVMSRLFFIFVHPVDWPLIAINHDFAPDVCLTVKFQQRSSRTDFPLSLVWETEDNCQTLHEIDFQVSSPNCWDIAIEKKKQVSYDKVTSTIHVCWRIVSSIKRTVKKSQLTIY